MDEMEWKNEFKALVMLSFLAIGMALAAIGTWEDAFSIADSSGRPPSGFLAENFGPENARLAGTVIWAGLSLLVFLIIVWRMRQIRAAAAPKPPRPVNTPR
ncbi:MAG TPA: hypothetical protein VGS22_05220 [Thermoanaerobaculia bacterium]|jgi:hypothetical protein|nr:hypothetical protein [Thermoanaerobaculia bacterium]